MTEDEARATLCHRTLAPFANAHGVTTYAPSVCIASDCMAWRWVVEIEYGHQWNGLAPSPPPKVTVTDRGYCGLAGRP